MRGEVDRGQSLVELATGLTVVMILLAGIVDLGRALFAKVALLDAAEEGALYGSLQPGDVSGIESRIRDNSDGPIDFTDTASVQVTVEYPGSACVGNLLRVRVDYQFLVATPFIGTILGTQTVALSASSESLILSPQCP